MSDDTGASLAAYLIEMEKELKAAVESGLDEAASIALEGMAEGSPKRSGRYAQGWINARAKDGGFYTGVRFLRNERKVRWKGQEIPLIVILENTSRRRPHVVRAWNRVRRRVRAAVKAAIENRIR